MDFNDIKSRLERLLASLNARFDEDVIRSTNVQRTEIDNRVFVYVNFGRGSTPDHENQILTILHNLSSLKDHLKNCLKTRGLKAKLVEDEINTSLHLQVMIDLVNLEKHGYPLLKPRSNLNPRISSVRTPLRLMSGDGQSSGIFLGGDGTTRNFGQSIVVLTASIVDGNGSPLFELDELVETCYQKWIDLATKHGCV
ncbi:MAG: hypothetical protein SFU83_14330 [Meiothermus sp.]|nr:hypothetical protein [Meiothermus sp.]